MDKIGNIAPEKSQLASSADYRSFLLGWKNANPVPAHADEPSFTTPHDVAEPTQYQLMLMNQASPPHTTVQNQHQQALPSMYQMSGPPASNQMGYQQMGIPPPATAGGNSSCC